MFMEEVLTFLYKLNNMPFSKMNGFFKKAELLLCLHAG